MNKTYGVVKKHVVEAGEEKILTPEEFNKHLEIRNATKEQISTGDFMDIDIFEQHEIEGLTEEEIQKMIDKEDESPTIQ